MASTNWDPTSDAPSTSLIRRGAVAGVGVPNGGGNFAYAINAFTSNAGFFGLYETDAGFDPLTKGGSISGAIRRLAGAPAGTQPTGPAPMLFCCLQGTASTALAYMLGLSASDPSRIVLRKGRLIDGLPNVEVGPAFGVLARGNKTFDLGAWAQLRLDVQVNLNGDSVVNCYMSELAANEVTAPIWIPIPGFPAADVVTGAQFVDDAAGVNTGSVPLAAGRLGFGHFSQAVSIATFDGLSASAQS